MTRAGIFWGGKANTGLSQNHVESYFAPHEAKLRESNNQEDLRRAYKDRQGINDFAVKHGLGVEEMRVVLTTLSAHEHQPLKNEDEARVRWEQNWEALKQKHGGEQGAREALERAESFQKAFSEQVPYLAERFAKTGASSALEVINVCARPRS